VREISWIEILLFDFMCVIVFSSGYFLGAPVCVAALYTHLHARVNIVSLFVFHFFLGIFFVQFLIGLVHHYCISTPQGTN
jgi:hypothetical protein